jgi:hypothetical protein
MDRPLFKATIQHLEGLLKGNPSDVFTLSRLREELTYRNTDRARQLLKVLEALLGGKVPMPPKPPRPARPEDQLELLRAPRSKNQNDVK